MTTIRGGNPVLFLDHDSIADLHWPVIWQSFAPVTALGRRAKADLQPYRTGEERAATESLEQLRADAAVLDLGAAAAIAGALEPVPDIADALAALTRPETVLSVKQLLALKQFLFHGAELAVTAAKLDWTAPARWNAVLLEFGEVSVPSFAIDHVADDRWRAAAALVTQATYAVHSAKQERDKAWQESVGARPSREGQIVLRLPEQRVLAERLMSDSRLTWLRNTPFEAVFDVQPTADLEAAQTRLAEAKEAQGVAQDQVLRGFCDALRARLPELRRLAEDIAALDLRVAKVRLLRHWNGAIPVIRDSVRLKGGVHPLVAARLDPALAVSAYVPLDFDPAVGPNVLCGANMGGKTVAMSLLCLCQALAQYGLPVPAEAFETRLFRFIRFSGHAGTDLDNGLSAFGREITNLTDTWTLWKEVGDGFVCLDEPARSTNPVEGEALVVALLRLVRAQPRNSIWIVATHLAGAVAEPGVTKFRVRGLLGERLPQDGLPSAGRQPPGGSQPPDETSPRGDQQQTDDERLRWLAGAMDYRVVRMTEDAPPGEALQVAEWLGMASEVLDESQRYLGEGKP